MTVAAHLGKSTSYLLPSAVLIDEAVLKPRCPFKGLAAFTEEDAVPSRCVIRQAPAVAQARPRVEVDASPLVSASLISQNAATAALVRCKSRASRARVAEVSGWWFSAVMTPVADAVAAGRWPAEPGRTAVGAMTPTRKSRPVAGRSGRSPQVCSSLRVVGG